MKLKDLVQGDQFRVSRNGDMSLTFIFGHIEGDTACCLFADGKLQGEQAELIADQEVEKSKP